MALVVARDSQAWIADYFDSKIANLDLRTHLPGNVFVQV